MADDLKDKGNKAFAAKDYDKAIDLFTQAIAIDSKNHVLYSNRSAAKAGKKDWDAALEDAEECIKVNPTWSKGYARKGAALHGAHRWDDAIAAYEEGLKIEDSPALKKGLQDVEQAKAMDEPAPDAGMGKIFSDPGLIAKLAANPRTAKHLADPAFMQKLRLLQSNPRLAEGGGVLQDTRMIDVMGVALGIDIQGFERPEGSTDLPPGVTSPPSFSSPSSSAPPPPRPTQPPSSSSSRAPPKADVVMEDPYNGLDEEEAKAKKEALEAKKVAGEAYKKREFEEAATLYQKAWDLWPKDVTFLTNLSAVQFEQGDYDQTIATCEKAVDEGRSLRADYKLLAKALGRIGTSYQKKSDFPSAIKYYEKSLTEHRTPDVLNKLREVEKIKVEADKAAYLDPVKGAAAREEGNVQFKAGQFADAVKTYTESIKRDPTDPRGYNNRAAAYTKLVALPEALKDVNEAIKIDPTFVKGYIRKSLVLFAMRDYIKALEAIQEAEEHDKEHKSTAEIRSQAAKCEQALWDQRQNESQEETVERAMRDPEVAGIMNDPVIQQILQQAQGNPGALQDHMKNPIVRGKIQKLINAGIIRTR